MWMNMPLPGLELIARYVKAHTAILWGSTKTKKANTILGKAVVVSGLSRWNAKTAKELSTSALAFIKANLRCISESLSQKNLCVSSKHNAVLLIISNGNCLPL